MKFDRSFAGDQLASDLFVEQPQYQKSEHLSLARGEQVIAVAQLGDLGPLLERVLVSLNSSTDGSWIPELASSRCRSKPLSPGRRTSSTRHAGPSGRGRPKNSPADRKV